MERLIYSLSLVAVVPLLAVGYYHLSFGQEADRVFLTVSTFLFTIFTSFFISRQASRFNRVRESVTAFDGQLSSLYRLSGHFGDNLQERVGAIIEAHYERVFSTNQWNVHFLERSDTLTRLHAELDTITDDDMTKLQNQALGAMVKSLAKCQGIRKRQVAMFEERVPLEQWTLILFFAAILIATVSTLPSVGFLLGSVLKAAFVVSIIAVLHILYKLNSLSYSEHLMGERSARDVVAIIAGEK